MTAKTTVGRSHRTEGKHKLLDKMIGAYSGVYTKGKPGLFDDPFVMIDLCAGDAAAGKDSSPAILDKHARYIRTQGRRADVHLVEKSPATFDKLAEATKGWDVNRVLGDARQVGIVPMQWHDDSPVFINNDPNNVQDFALSAELVSGLPYWTTTLSTLGCNAGGLKRMSHEDRLRWYAHVDTVTSTLRANKDALLITLLRDASQFAFLITTPITWRDKAESWASAAYGKQGVGIDIAWWRKDRPAWDMLVDTLFLTQKELANGSDS